MSVRSLAFALVPLVVCSFTGASPAGVAPARTAAPSHGDHKLRAAPRAASNAALRPRPGTRPSDPRERVIEPQLATIAGTGARGRDDGAASAASFMSPVGVAVARDGTVYVADAGANDIRRIRAAHVDTIAGDADPGLSPEIRIGGFADGELAQARFNRPIALAVHDSDLYVADAGNHCIREIAGDRVTTFAGTRRSGSDDGAPLSASFLNIKGIAAADDGTLYVADDGVGIRRIDRGGVTTLALPSDRKTVLGVAVRSLGGRDYLAYTDDTHLYLGALGAAKPLSMAFDDEREPDGAGLGVGHAYGIAILNENTVVVSDVTTHAVRFVRFPAPPFVDGATVRAIAGGVNEGGDVAGAFADGPPGVSRLDTPTAIALAPDGSLIVADAGNRRIRRITSLDPRESVLPDLSNFAIADRSYHVAVVGNSYAFYDVLWPESIGGRIEAGLTRDALAIGLPARPSVSTFRIDAASDEAQISVIHEYLYDHRTNIIVLLLNAYVPMRSDTLARLREQLDKIGIKLLVVVTPQGFDLSPHDFWNGRRDRGDYDFAKLREASARNESYYAMTGVRGLFLLDAMEAENAERNRPPLFYASEHHLTVYGSQWVGRRVLDEIERWRPWRAEPPAAGR